MKVSAKVGFKRKKESRMCQKSKARLGDPALFIALYFVSLIRISLVFRVELLWFIFTITRISNLDLEDLYPVHAPFSYNVES